MKMKFNLLFGLLCIPATLFAETTYPRDLLYLGKPIDPLCFTDTLPNSKQLIPLSKCGLNAEPNRKITGYNELLHKKGYIGYDYSESEVNGGFASHGYSYYKILGHVNQAYIISTIDNTGGNGETTAIYLVKRDQDNLQLKLLSEPGNRCDEGISHIQTTKNTILYSVNLTARDFIDTDQTNPYQLVAPDDLQDCAVCCRAKVIYKIDLTQQEIKPLLIYIDFGKTLIKPDPHIPGKYQFCFDQLIADYQKRGNHKLSPQEFHEFMQTFYATCIKKP